MTDRAAGAAAAAAAAAGRAAGADRAAGAGAGAAAGAAAQLTAANRAIVEDFARLFYTERNVPSAFGRYVAVDYIQHNPSAGNGRDAAIAFLAPMFSAEGARFEIQRIVVDGDLAAIHVRAQPPGRMLAVADFYRLAGGLIVEHWDVLQPVPPSTASHMF